MTLRIESGSGLSGNTIRLIGRMQQEHLEDMQSLIQAVGPSVILDLEQLNLVDVEAVRFLGTCERDGIRIIHCPAYIRDWIDKENSLR